MAAAEVASRPRGRDWTHWLRAARTLAYRAASPVERRARRWRGLGELPPLWLRRHAGAPRHFLDAARETADWLDRFELVEPSSRVLDVGCGCGAMVPEFARRLGADGRYTGFDVHAPSVEWCRRAHAADDRFRFELAVLDSPYAAGGSIESEKPEPPESPTEYQFPAEDGTVDLVLAKSVFTHLLAADACHYLREIRRVLATEGRAFVTFFLFDGDRFPEPAAFPHPPGAADVRWRREHHPHAAVAFERGRVEAMVDEAGLRFEALVEGYWPGEAPEPAGQDQLVLARRD